MGDILVDYAVRNIWCNPRQDDSYVFSPKRITGHNGAINTVVVVDRVLPLPKSGVRYHVYQVGQINPDLLNIIRDEPDWTMDRWISFTDSINHNAVLMAFYDGSGVNVPRYMAHTMYMDERNLIIAIEVDATLMFDYSTTAYFRVYRNKYFDSPRYTGNVKMYTEGEKVAYLSDILSLQTTYLGYQEKPGYVFAYVNGLLVESISPLTVQPHDHVEFLYDASVKRVVDLPIRTLATYMSRIDNVWKYLLHYQANDVNTIEYFDDVDLYIIDMGEVFGFTGSFLYRHMVSTMRMVTHRDYGISTSAVVYIAEKLKELLSRSSPVEDFRIKMFIRHSGYDRALIYEGHRLHELYKLDDICISDSLLGSGTSTPIWRCEELEASGYASLMSGNDGITRDMVIDALGYNAISKLYCDTPQLKSVDGTVKLSVLMQVNSTVYEYDQGGLLLGYAYHASGAEHIPQNPDAVLFEAIRGIGTSKPEVYYGVTVPYVSGCNWRLYKAHTLRGEVDGIWSDITDTTEYTIDAGVIRYIGNDVNTYFMLRTDRKFLAYDLNVVAIDGCIRFPLSQYEDRDGEDKHYVMTIPAGELDIFMNEHSLIEGVDYIVRFPFVCIISKEYLNEPSDTAVQRLHIRFKGLADAMQREVSEDTGFIEHGVLSNNDRFDIHDDRILRIVVGGKLKTKEDVLFSELHSGVSIVNALNGKPYSIRDIAMPLRDVVYTDTYAFRKQARAIDGMVSGYMSDKLPQPNRDGVSVIQRLYVLYSPFICKLLHDIVSRTLPAEVYSVNMNDQDVLNACKGYEDWLAFDPASHQNSFDDMYTIVHPHNRQDVMVINLYAYRFMMRVIRLYMPGKVELSPYVAVEHQI